MSGSRPIFGLGLLEAWERCSNRSPVERALTLLEFANPGIPRAALEALDLRERDRLLLDLRALSLGPEIDGRFQCTKCSEWLEFTLETPVLQSMLEKPIPSSVISHDEYELRFRQANSDDMVLATRAQDTDAACRILLERCVDVRDREGHCVTIDELPAEACAAAFDRLDALHDEAEIRLDFVCAACGAQHRMNFDVGAFFWLEIHQTARRLLDDVHDLAWAYGWPEGEILAMSSLRRQAYLDRVWQ
jgi:hypothetical protein